MWFNHMYVHIYILISIYSLYEVSKHILISRAILLLQSIEFEKQAAVCDGAGGAAVY